MGLNRISRRSFLLATAAFGLVTACDATQSSQEDVSRNGTPKRIVALEWFLVEYLLALGIQPVGVADIGGYQKFVNIQPELADNVENLGTRQEPNLEAIAVLQPDLILGVQSRHGRIKDTLSAIAPTMLFNTYSPSENGTQLERMKEVFLVIAARINRRDKGEAVVQEMQASFAAAAQTLEASSLANRSFVLAQFIEGAPQLRLFTDNAMAVQILSEIGLKNAWNGELTRLGFNTVWLEALPAIEQANFFYVTQDNNAYFQKMQDNPLWGGLEFVQQNRVYPLGGNTWLFGGPLSAQLLVEKAVTALSQK